MRDWDDAFAITAHIPGAEALPEYWKQQAAAYREGLPDMEQDIPYGSSERERFDLVWPEGEPRGLAVFVHGGYWMRDFDKSYWTHLTQGASDRGFAVCLPSYMLTPTARISQITTQVCAAIAVAAGRVAGPIHLAGHSAGGHLVTRMICADTRLPATVLGRIAHTLSISGVHDLRPLLHTQMNDTLHLDAAEAARESAVLHRPFGTPRVTAWVGGGERPEFIRQARLLALMWDGLDADIRLEIDGTEDHFTLLEGLRDAGSAITRAFVGSGRDGAGA